MTNHEVIDLLDANRNERGVKSWDRRQKYSKATDLGLLNFASLLKRLVASARISKMKTLGHAWP